MRWRDWLPFGEVPEIEPGDLAVRLAGPAPPVVVDVRTAMEFRLGHIAGSRHVPVQRLGVALPVLSLDARVTVVAVCKTAHRSIPAVRRLRAQGFMAVQLAGGFDRWRRQGLPVIRGDAS